MRLARAGPEPRPCASRYASSSAVGSISVASSVMPCVPPSWLDRARTLPDGFRHDGGRLDLHARPGFDQRDDLHHRHRGVVVAHELAVGGADLAGACEVLVAVGDVPRQARDVLGATARLGQHGEHVAQRLADLAGQVLGRERARLVPADLARDEHERPALGGDAVRVPARARPGRRLEHPHGRSESIARRRVRCTLPVGVRGSASRNWIRRGYLYGAIRALTWAWRSAASASPATAPGVATTNALTTWPRSSSGEATTAHSATAGCSSSADSTSAPEML